jgi:hypothetical protein
LTVVMEILIIPPVKRKNKLSLFIL